MALNRGIRRPRHLSLTILASLMPLAAIAAEPVALEQQVVTATQTAHSELSAPASVSVVTREELEQRPVYNLADAVKYLPGVHVNPSSTYGRQEIKIRGLDSDYTLLLVNGRRINSRDALTSNYANDFDLSAIPMAAVERIEVIRGPMTSLYGADAMGGVINVILRQPTNQTEAGVSYSYEHPTEGDSGDSHKASGYLSGALIEDKLLGNLILDTADQAAWQSDQLRLEGTDAAEKRQNVSAMGTLSWLLDERQSIDLDMSYREDDRKARWNNAGAPQPLTTNIQEMDRWTLGLTHNGRWEGFNTRLRYYYEEVELMDDSQLMTTMRRAKGDVNQTNHTVDGQISAFIGNQLFTLGSEFRRTELTHNQNLGTDTEVDQKAIYLQDEFSLGALDVTLGGRWDHHEVFGSEFSPRAYGVYNLSDNWVIKGGAGKAFKAPSISQSDPNYGVLACRGMCTVFGNPNLKPETSTSYELGTQYQTERLEAGVMFFHNDIDDLIITETTRLVFNPVLGRPVPLRSELSYYNLSKARIKGYELQGRYQLSDAVSVRANYTYSDSEDRETGDELDYTPKHVGNLGVDWRALPQLDLNLDYQYTGSQMVYVPALANSERSDEFHTLGVGARFRATNELTLNAGLNNLTNEKRDEVAQSVDHILMGRTVFVGFSYDI
ncbi:TonB-dependent receptor [Stutzerimonas zhaodongensis]